MDIETETAAVVALLRSEKRSSKAYGAALSASSCATALLEEEQGLLAEGMLSAARSELQSWQRRGIRVLSTFDPSYPAKLTWAPDQPPLLFVVGDLAALGGPSVAVAGTRSPSPAGRRITRALSHRLVLEGYSVVSGLAAGIDGMAHRAALEKNGHTVGVIGTGVDHSYPRENSALQHEIGQRGTLVSQFWPENRPNRASFPMRNILMAALSDATVIVEAGAMSGTRILARAALEMARPVILLEALMGQAWARELAERRGVVVATSAAHVTAVLAGTSGTSAFA